MTGWYITLNIPTANYTSAQMTSTLSILEKTLQRSYGTHDVMTALEFPFTAYLKG